MDNNLIKIRKAKKEDIRKEQLFVMEEAGDGKMHGILRSAVRFCEQRIHHLRIDTHENNQVMRHLIVKCGFRECGVIHVKDGTPRIAFERV